MNSIAQEWLDQAKWAASGGNAQPWDVSFNEGPTQIIFKLRISPQYIPHKSPMDLDGGASVLALGCLTTNLIHLGRSQGFELETKKIINGDDLWSSYVLLSFIKSSSTMKFLSSEQIRLRHTDRYKYSTQEVSLELRTQIQQTMSKYSLLQTTVIREKRELLIRELAKLEAVRWSNEKLLSGLLLEVNFDPTQASGEGIPVSQLGGSKMDEKMLWGFFKYPFLRILLKLGGVAPIIQQAVVKPLRNCDRIYFLQASQNSFAAWYELGLCFQELWIEINSAKVSFQPIGLPFIAINHWNEINREFYSPREKHLIEEASKNLEREFALDLKKPLIGFRIGYPTKQAARSPRKDLIGKVDPGLTNLL